jgi:hypothetical protein
MIDESFFDANARRLTRRLEVPEAVSFVVRALDRAIDQEFTVFSLEDFVFRFRVVFVQAIHQSLSGIPRMKDCKSLQIE